MSAAAKNATPAALHDTPDARSEAMAIANEVHASVAHELAPLLCGIALLTDALRVLEALDFRARLDPEFARALAAACSTWRNPLASDNEELISQLAWLAKEMAADLVDRTAANCAASRS